MTLLLTCTAQDQATVTQTAAAQTPVAVQTDQGAVTGRQGTANSFLGIPYAASEQSALATAAGRADLDGSA
ncbi:hypothetical protein [Deinococcus sp. QL22]|uniref:hypothetical protein n=1 Tax=Deinococcus sp. QL22 TaxID=2939437 RepID=UPI0020176B1C|nr:hypothetical protein [Deinococcus sp. QL22]UQN10055.1 hypothetical protein M1R55_27005 [Deinococcus sp. QL22]